MTTKTADLLLADDVERPSGALTPIVSAALFLEAMTVSITAMAIPNMATDTGASLAILQWTHGAFIIGFAGLLMLGGRVSDLLGRKRTFLIAAALFGAFGLVVTLAPNLMSVFIARGLQGAAAAFMIPASISILTHVFPEGPKRNKALSTFNAAGAAGFSAGLMVGGFVIEYFGWRWAFGLNFPAALIIVAAGFAVIPNARPMARDGAGLDIPGAVLVGTALTSFVLALTLMAEHGMSLVELGLIALAVALGAIFLKVERRAASPLIPLSLFQNSSLRHANLGSLTLLGSFFGFNLIINILLVEQFGLSPTDVGFILLPMALLCVVIAQAVVPRLIDRFGIFQVAAAGLAALGVAAGSAAGLAVFGGDAFSLPILAILAALAGGVGMGLAYAPLAIGAVSGVEESDQGVAAGLQQTTLQIGGVLGIALAVGGQTLAGDYWGGFVVAGAIGAAGFFISITKGKMADARP